MKFESKYSLDDVLSLNWGGHLVKVKGIAFCNEGVTYSCRRTDGSFVVAMEDELNDDDANSDKLES